MKKYIAILALALTATTALAQHHGHGFRHNHHRGHYYGHGGWVAPLIIGSTLGYVLTRPAPVVVEQPPVYVQPQVVQPQCTRYIYQDQNGQVLREEIRCN
jgi:uncharacterized protein YdeI (BOF family)